MDWPVLLYNYVIVILLLLTWLYDYDNGVLEIVIQPNGQIWLNRPIRIYKSDLNPLGT